jgi:hypothetical protein
MPLRSTPMIVVRGPRVTWIFKQDWAVKIYQRTANSRQSVQVVPDLARPWFIENYTYFAKHFRVTPHAIDVCRELRSVRELIRKHCDIQSRAI